MLHYTTYKTFMYLGLILYITKKIVVILRNKKCSQNLAIKNKEEPSLRSFESSFQRINLVDVLNDNCYVAAVFIREF